MQTYLALGTLVFAALGAYRALELVHGRFGNANRLPTVALGVLLLAAIFVYVFAVIVTGASDCLAGVMSRDGFECFEYAE